MLHIVNNKGKNIFVCDNSYYCVVSMCHLCFVVYIRFCSKVIVSSSHFNTIVQKRSLILDIGSIQLLSCNISLLRISGFICINIKLHHVMKQQNYKSWTLFTGSSVVMWLPQYLQGTVKELELEEILFCMSASSESGRDCGKWHSLSCQQRVWRKS